MRRILFGNKPEHAKSAKMVGTRIVATCFFGGALTFLMLKTWVSSLEGWGLVGSTVAGAAFGYFLYNLPEATQASFQALRVGFMGARPTALCSTIHRPQARPLLVGYMGVSFLFQQGVRLILSYSETLSHFAKPVGIAFISALLAAVFSWYFLRITIFVRPKTKQKWITLIGCDSVTDDDSEKTLSAILCDPTSPLPWKTGLALYKDGFCNLPLVIYRVGLFFIALPRSIARQVVRVFVTIHSQPHLICAVDIPMGALITFWAFHKEIWSLSPATQLGLATLAGMISLLIGLLNYKLIAKPLLQL